MTNSLSPKAGFTLIELSIVLVIIGLIVGGILVGRDLVSAAQVRAQIAQVEKYNQAVNVFKSKYNGLPGDLAASQASQFGFNKNCSGVPAARDGNGLIDGGTPPTVLGQAQNETGLLWQDLSQAGLIESTFDSITSCNNASGTILVTQLNSYIPLAKLGNSNFVYAYETSGANWWAVTGISFIVGAGSVHVLQDISVNQAYKIDAKIDDGLPTTGNVLANYTSSDEVTILSANNTTISGGTSSSCYDTTTSTYSVTVNNGSGANCALSFKFQ